MSKHLCREILDCIRISSFVIISSCTTSNFQPSTFQQAAPSTPESVSTSMEEATEEATEEYIVKTHLACLPWVKPVIEELLQRVSRIASYGTALYALLLLKRFESGEPFTCAFTKQSTVLACLRAVCARDPSRPPQPVIYEDKTVQRCIQDVQSLMLPAMRSWDARRPEMIENWSAKC